MKTRSFFLLLLCMLCITNFAHPSSFEVVVTEEVSSQKKIVEDSVADRDLKQQECKELALIVLIVILVVLIICCGCSGCLCKQKVIGLGDCLQNGQKSIPDYVNPSDEWMRFFYKDYDVKLQQWEARFYQRIFSMQLLEGVFILLWVLVAVCWVIWNEENNKKWMLGFIGIGISLAGVINALCLLRANRQLTAFRQENREKQKEYFDKCHGKAFTALRNATDKREYPDEMQKTTSYCWWIHLIGWIVMLIIIGIALFLISIK